MCRAQLIFQKSLTPRATFNGIAKISDRQPKHFGVLPETTLPFARRVQRTSAHSLAMTNRFVFPALQSCPKPDGWIEMCRRHGPKPAQALAVERPRKKILLRYHERSWSHWHRQRYRPIRPSAVLPEPCRRPCYTFGSIHRVHIGWASETSPNRLQSNGPTTQKLQSQCQFMFVAAAKIHQCRFVFRLPCSQNDPLHVD